MEIYIWKKEPQQVDPLYIVVYIQAAVAREFGES